MVKRPGFFSAGFLATGLLVGAASAQDVAATCTNAGNIYKVGDFACIAACHGARRLARCDMLSTQASWTYVSDVCPSAWLVPGPPDNASQLPVVAAMTPLPGPLKINTIAPDMATVLASYRVEISR